MSTPETVDASIASFPPEVADGLARVRAIITDRLDGGEESIRYGMAAVMLGPRHGLHLGGWKKHIGLYPVPVLDEPLERRSLRAGPARTPSGSVTTASSRTSWSAGSATRSSSSAGGLELARAARASGLAFVSSVRLR